MNKVKIAKQLLVLAKELMAKKQEYRDYTIEKSGDNFYVTDPSGHRAFGEIPSSVETAKKWIDQDIREKGSKHAVASSLVKLAIELSSDVDWADDTAEMKSMGLNERTIQKMEKEKENAKHLFKKAIQDGPFRKLHDAISSKAVHYNATSSSRSFSFHAPLPQMLDAMKEQGWGDENDEMAKLVSRKVYSHPDSPITVMRAEGDAFVVTV